MTGYPETATGLPAPGPGVADAAGPGPIRPLHTILELAALPSAVPCARRHARGVVGEWGLPTAARTTELLVSEMITNAVAETAGTQDPLGGVITLRLTAAIGTVLIEVHDPSPRLPERKGSTRRRGTRPGPVAGRRAERRLGRLPATRKRQDRLVPGNGSTSRTTAAIRSRSSRSLSSPTAPQRAPAISSACSGPMSAAVRKQNLKSKCRCSGSSLAGLAGIRCALIRIGSGRSAVTLPAGTPVSSASSRRAAASSVSSTGSR